MACTGKDFFVYIYRVQDTLTASLKGPAEFNACLRVEMPGEKGRCWNYIRDTASTCFVRLLVSTFLSVHGCSVEREVDMRNPI